MCRTCSYEREASISEEEVGISTQKTRRGMDPSTYTKIIEIMSGKTVFQQGFVTTCKDRTCKVQKLRCTEKFGLTHEPVRAMKAG